MKICPNCGYKQSSDNKFCTECGHSMENVPLANKVNVGEKTQKDVKAPKLNKKKPTLIGIVALIIIALVGGYIYYTSPSHNPSNPLSNQQITFKIRKIANSDDGESDNDEDDEDENSDDDKHYALTLSDESLTKIDMNVILLMLKKKDKGVYDYLQKHPDAVQYLSDTMLAEIKQTEAPKPSKKLEEESKELDRISKKDKNFDQTFDDWEKWGKSTIKPAENIVLVQISPNYGEDARNNQKVQVQLAGKQAILQKYGINLKPRKVKISGLKY